VRFDAPQKTLDFKGFFYEKKAKKVKITLAYGIQL